MRRKLMKFFLNLDFKNILRDEREQSILGEDNDSERGQMENDPSAHFVRFKIIYYFEISSFFEIYDDPIARILHANDPTINYL